MAFGIPHGSVLRLAVGNFQTSNWKHLLDYKQENSRRTTSTSASLIIVKPLVVWITANFGKFLEKWEPAS